MKKKYLFSLAFFALSYATSLYSLSNLSGGRFKFTLFDVLAPASMAILGPVAGAVNIVAVTFLNFFTVQSDSSFTAGIVHIFTGLMAAWFFSRKSVFNYLIPVIAIALFVVHPIGRTVWYFALLWTIPLIMNQLRSSTFAKSLGAVFAAHSVGGAAWIYLFNLKASIWQSLIPIVIAERLALAIAVTLAYIGVRELQKVWMKSKVLEETKQVAVQE